MEELDPYTQISIYQQTFGRICTHFDIHEALHPIKVPERKTPFEAYYGKKPTLSHLQEIECHGFTLKQGINPKIYYWSIECILIGTHQTQRPTSATMTIMESTNITQCLFHQFPRCHKCQYWPRRWGWGLWSTYAGQCTGQNLGGLVDPDPTPQIWV